MLFVLPPRSSRRPQRFSIWHIEPSPFGEKNFRSLGLPGSNINPKKTRKASLAIHDQRVVNISWILLPRKLLCTLKNGASKTAKLVELSPNCRGNSLVLRGVMVPSGLLAGNDVVFKAIELSTYCRSLPPPKSHHPGGWKRRLRKQQSNQGVTTQHTMENVTICDQ